MTDLDRIKNLVDSDNDIKNALLRLVEYVVTKKKLKIPISEFAVDTILIQNNFLEVKNDNYCIINIPAIAYLLIEQYKILYNFVQCENFSDTTIFLKKIKDDFNSNGRVYDYRSLEKSLWELLIIESNQSFKSNFANYLLTLTNEENTEDIFLFIEAYSNSLKDLDISEEVIYNNSITLLEFAKSDATYNLPLGNILNGIKQKCSIDYSFGFNLFNTAIDKDVVNDNILSAIVNGLYELKGVEYYDQYLVNLIEDQKFQKGIFAGLSNLTLINEIDAQLFIALFDKFEGKDELINSLIQIIFTIIKANDLKNKESCLKECFIRLHKCLKKEITVYLILHNISFIENHQIEKVDLIVDIIEQDYFTIAKHLKPIEQVFWYIKDIQSLRLVLIKIASQKPYESVVNYFGSAFTDIEKRELDKLLIELLTDNEASRRFIGVDIFNHHSSHTSFKFDIDILEQDPIIQYKLWVALSQDFKEPKYFIPALLPLLNSKSEIVKESFICKLEEYSEDYGGHIIEILENNLSKDSPINLEIIDRINTYLDDFCAININIKKHIKELNPSYTNSKIFNYHNELFYKKMSRTIHDGAEKNSLLGVLGVNTVQLSKGGGWKSGNKKEISKLGTVGSSFSLPRSYFINPNKFEIERSHEMKSNWSDLEFKEIEDFIKNEQQ